MPLRSEIIEMGHQAGAVAVGFATAGPVDSDHWRRFTDFIDRGAHFSMTWLENYPDIRRNPLLLFSPPATEGTVISFAFPYRHADFNPLFARYAQGTDYHKELRRRLRPIARRITEDTGCRSRVCIDSAPLLERYWAVRSGIGSIGLNHALQVRGAGSYLFLAEIITEAVIPPGAAIFTAGGASCSRCGRCVEACPHGALGSDGSFDSSRCQSCLTIEYSGPLTLPLKGAAAYGCDICQQVCPLNSNPAPGLSPFAPSAEMLSLSPENLGAMSDDAYTRFFSDSAVRRVTLQQLKRNLAALICRNRK